MKLNGKTIFVLITVSMVGLLAYTCWYNCITLTGDLTPLVDRLLQSEDKIDKFKLNAPVDGVLHEITCYDQEVLPFLKEMEKMENPAVGRVISGWIYFGQRRFRCSVKIGGGADVCLSFCKDWLDGSSDYHLPHSSPMRKWVLDNLRAMGVEL